MSPSSSTAAWKQPCEGEDRKVIPSPKDVPTYDLKPEMSAPEVADECARPALRAASTM